MLDGTVLMILDDGTIFIRAWSWARWDVIEDVFCAIEEDTEWYGEYGELAKEHTPENTNRWIGQWVRRLLGSPKFLSLADSRRSSLTERYSRLDV